MPKIFIPSIKKESGGVSGQSDRDILLYLIVDSSYQQRTKMYHNKLLSLAAQRKADEMSSLDYFGHTSPAGVTANENVRSAGYSLPDFYPVKGNNVESLSIGGTRMEEIVEGWYSSSKHKGHVFGLLDFYKSQECAGIGLSVAKDGRTLAVFLSAPCL